ncbi:hypothetical protein K458DRAFT_483314 [Lentithecium fluviatile CBS 122367]|uniref:Uncharacterized protein n=1 Tax=Lentithecium fluviatile CBS 122367 TaxID=1168545 RepID=A0A6G1JM91_9PLEO|nr:hypothetical protein K458DRAFT_483314 [Lentithecium fluviatile CBS 122367]
MASKLRRKTTSESGTEEQPVGLDLAYACKIAANEMRGIPFRTNKIKSTVGSSNNHQGGHRGLQSRAGRFRCLLKYAQETQLRMAFHIAELMTPQVLQSLEELVIQPSVTTLECPYAQRIQLSTTLEYLATYSGLDQYKGMIEIWNFRQHFNDGPQYVLEIAHSKSRTRFTELASKAFGTEPPLLKASGVALVRLAARMPWRYYFVEGLLPAVLSWKPDPWEIPSEEELRDLEGRLIEPKSLAQVEAWIAQQGRRYVKHEDFDMFEESQDTRWFFSAVAVAINFLQSIPSAQRQQIRHITLKEDFKSVYYPASHARGLIPFLKENRNLRIERHVGLHHNMLPLGWFGVDNRPAPYFYPLPYSLARIISLLAEWIEEASMICASGLTSSAFSLVFECYTEGAQIWEILKSAAALQEAMIGSYHQHAISLPALETDPLLIAHHYPLPCHLPSSFAQTIRASLEGDSLLQLRGPAGDVWNTAELVRAREHRDIDA